MKGSVFITLTFFILVGCGDKSFVTKEDLENSNTSKKQGLCLIGGYEILSLGQSIKVATASVVSRTSYGESDCRTNYNGEVSNEYDHQTGEKTRVCYSRITAYAKKICSNRTGVEEDQITAVIHSLSKEAATGACYTACDN